MQVRTHIEDAIRIAGSEAKLGKAAGFSQHAIWKAKAMGIVSPQLALGIHRATGGVVSASKLRPDLWPTVQHVPLSAPSVAPDTDPERPTKAEAQTS